MGLQVQIAAQEDRSPISLRVRPLRQMLCLTAHRPLSITAPQYAFGDKFIDTLVSQIY
jgi:hypothetical protein